MLERTFRGIDVDFFAFPDGFKALVIWDVTSFLLVDPRSPE